MNTKRLPVSAAFFRLSKEEGAVAVLVSILIFNIYNYKKVSNFHDSTANIIEHELEMVVNNEKLGMNVGRIYSFTIK